MAGSGLFDIGEKRLKVRCEHMRFWRGLCADPAGGGGVRYRWLCFGDHRLIAEAAKRSMRLGLSIATCFACFEYVNVSRDSLVRDWAWVVDGRVWVIGRGQRGTYPPSNRFRTLSRSIPEIANCITEPIARSVACMSAWPALQWLWSMSPMPKAGTR